MIHPGFPRSRSYNPCSVSQLQSIPLLTSGISQPVPRYSGELWALHSGPIQIPVPILTLLLLKYLKSREIPSLKHKKIPRVVPANYSTMMRKNTNMLTN